MNASPEIQMHRMVIARDRATTRAYLDQVEDLASLVGIDPEALIAFARYFGKDAHSIDPGHDATFVCGFLLALELVVMTLQEDEEVSSDR